jgi:hypothetical protein
MHRVTVALVAATVLVFGFMGGAPTRSDAQTGSPAPPATPSMDGLCVGNEGANWLAADVRPTGQADAAVYPATPVAASPVAATPAATGTATTPVERPYQLYLVEIRLAPDECMPYSALGNQKRGAIVMIVQQGTVKFQWEPLASGIQGDKPAVVRGDARGRATAPPGGQPGEVPAGTPQTLVPGDWITLNQEVKFSYRNVGSDTAIILKAVWTNSGGGGCGGGCR